MSKDVKWLLTGIGVGVGSGLAGAVVFGGVVTFGSIIVWAFWRGLRPGKGMGY